MSNEFEVRDGSSRRYALFSAIGIEIEYMLVDKTTLDIVPVSDIILQTIAGKLVNEASLGDINVSNELVMHVLELKNQSPAPLNAPLNKQFQQAIRQLIPLLEAHHVMLLPSGAHPFMNPHTQTKRWPHDNQEIYQQYDAIFDCKGHGWANLQSVHINLPFANDAEFEKLHAAIRLILPLIPALAASSPILDGELTGHLDTRLHYYGINQAKIPAITAGVIPIPVQSQHAYEAMILEPMYAAIRPFDQAGILQEPWLNSRGAIPKFDVGAIEIRLMDSQECINADIALVRGMTAILKHWISDSHDYLENPYDTGLLQTLYQQVLQHGMDCIVTDYTLMQQWGLPCGKKTVRDIWAMLIDTVNHELDTTSQKALETLLNEGNLSTRLIRALNGQITHKSLIDLYRQLNNCLYHNEMLSLS